MNERVRNYLIDVARNRVNQKVHYQKMCDDCNLSLDMSMPHHRGEVGKMLGEISAYEHSKGRPLISAMVIRSGDNYQGDGFFKLAEELGEGSWKKLRDSSFDIEQMPECIKFWNDEDNYNKYK